jgi:predicted PurR-regulated permease PerM
MAENQNGQRAAYILLAGLVILLIWYAVELLFLAFAAILLAIFLDGIASWLSNHSFLSRGWALVCVLTVIGLVGWLIVELIWPRLSHQADLLSEALPLSLDRLQAYMSNYPWMQRIFQGSMDRIFNQQRMLQQATGLLSSTLGILVNFVIVLVVAIYLASNPSLYRDGIIRLTPPDYRDRSRRLLNLIGMTLRRWLLGRFLLMISNGIITSVGLWIMGIPLALTLGIIAGLLNFIPNLGPIIASIPAILIALLQSPADALKVAIFYLAVQAVDGYLFTPLVQKWTVSLPPAITILSQVLLGILTGTLGVLLATPLAATAVVVIKVTYLHYYLREKVEIAGTVLEPDRG